MTTFTNSEIRTAILKAADQIEHNPGLFRFTRLYVPECGSPGCAAGWIGHFAGVPVGTNLSAAMKAIAGYDYPTFSDRMLRINGNWPWGGKVCAETMRLYADKYHPADKPVSGELPDAIKRIFAGEVLA